MYTCLKKESYRNEDYYDKIHFLHPMEGYLNISEAEIQ